MSMSGPFVKASSESKLLLGKVASSSAMQPAPGTGGAAGGGPLDFLRTNPQFIALRQIVQSNPMILQPMLQVGGTLLCKSEPTCLEPEPAIELAFCDCVTYQA